MRKIELFHLTRQRSKHPKTQHEVLADAGIVAYLHGAQAGPLKPSSLLAGSGGAVSSILPQSAGQNEAPGRQVDQQLAALNQALSGLTSAQQQQTSTLTQNTQAVAQNTAAKSSGGSAAGTVGSIASNLFGSAFSFSPIISGLFSLFGGGSHTQSVPPLVPFSLPSAIQYEGGYSASQGGQVAPVDHGQNGQVRSTIVNYTPNVQVQVSAMDSKSFLDHSDDIAGAVKQALLNSNSLKDVIADL